MSAMQVTQLTCLTNLRSVMVWSDFQIDVSEHGLGLAMGLGAGHGHGQLPLHGAHAHPMPLPAHGLVPVGPGVAVAAVDQNGQVGHLCAGLPYASICRGFVVGSVMCDYLGERR